MKNRFYYYQLLDEREEQLFNKAGSESFYICIALSLLSYIISVLAPSLFNSNMLLIVIHHRDILLFQSCPLSGSDLL